MRRIEQNLTTLFRHLQDRIANMCGVGGGNNTEVRCALALSFSSTSEIVTSVPWRWPSACDVDAFFSLSRGDSICFLWVFLSLLRSGDVCVSVNCFSIREGEALEQEEKQGLIECLVFVDYILICSAFDDYFPFCIKVTSFGVLGSCGIKDPPPPPSSRWRIF